MKLALHIFALLAFLFVFCGESKAQYTAEKIASHIAMDCNGSMADYMDYSVKLASLLSNYSPAALQRIMGANYVQAPSLNDQLGLSPINFGLKSPVLTASAKVELDKVLAYLNEDPAVNISIGGHTSLDFPGATELSESRALAAKLYLASKGIDPSRIESLGFGYSNPISEDGGYDPANQRIEIREEG